MWKRNTPFNTIHCLKSLHSRLSYPGLKLSNFTVQCERLWCSANLTVCSKQPSIFLFLGSSEFVRCYNIFPAKGRCALIKWWWISIGQNAPCVTSYLNCSYDKAINNDYDFFGCTLWQYYGYLTKVWALDKGEWIYEYCFHVWNQMFTI